MRTSKTWTMLGLCALALAACIAAIGQRSSPVSATGALQITAGGFHTCVLTSSGGVECWGRNDFGQLGNGTTTNSATPVPVSGLSSGAIAVSAGGYHTCAITSTHGLQCWGRNSYGQLGNGTIADSLTPVDVSGFGSEIATVSAGGFHTCAVTTTGVAKCWGRNDSAQLGDGTATNRTSPADVLGFPDGAAAVSAGGSDTFGGHSCGVGIAGDAQCWGRDDFGQVGDGAPGGHLTPVQVDGLTSGVADVRAGRYHSCALMASGGVKCWGWNNGGQLGDGSNTTRTTPVDVVDLANAAAALAVGGSHSCVVTTSGGVKCWGYNNVGQIGDGTVSTLRLTPVDVLESQGGPPLLDVASVAAGGNVTTGGHTCVLTNAGAAKCWGGNGYGQLGDGTTAVRPSPVDVIGIAPEPTPTATPSPTPTFTPPPAPSMTPVPPTIEELLGDLDETVAGLDLPNGTLKSLGSKLDTVLKLVERDKLCTAANPLVAFVNQIEALAQSGRLSADDASELIAQAEHIGDALLAAGDCS